MKIPIRRPSHATVVAYVALLAALGGSAYAASKVGTKDLKANAVTSPKIDNGTIRAGDVKRFALRSERVPVGAGSPPDATTDAVARCKRGEKAVAGGGGWGVQGPGVMATLVKSEPFGRTGWQVVGAPGSAANTLIATAVCMRK